MRGGSQLFEVHVQREGRWTIDRTATSQGEAEETARRLLRGQGVSAVKVVRTVDHASTSRETVVFEQSRATSGGGRVFVGEIDEAPNCDDPDDLFDSRGRATINRLFRSYLDKRGVTASEVMHDFKEMRRALDADNLVMSAVGKVATLQARGNKDIGMAERRDTLHGFVDTIFAKAKDASQQKLPSVAKDGFESAITSILDRFNGDAEYMARVAMSRDLLTVRDYYGKLVQMLDWTEPTEDHRARGLGDGFIADMTANATVLQDLLGPQPDLATALGTMVDLSVGGLNLADDGKQDSPAAITRRLNAMLAEDGLVETRGALIDRVCRQLDGKQPLVKGDPESEIDVFRDFVRKVTRDDDLVGGGAMAQALTSRQSRLLNKGGLTGLKEATSRVLPAFKDPVQKASYLLALKDSRMGEQLNGEIEMQLEGLFVQPEKLRQIIRDDRPPNKKMQAVTAVVNKIGGSCLTDPVKRKITEHLDELLAQFIVNDQILEKIDDPSRPLHIRAFMLLSMCTPEVLPEGKASALARKIILKHLRRPNFETELIRQVPEPEQEEVLRRFHLQLYRCGFMGA